MIDESDNESINESINESDNKSINESDNKNTTNWFDKNKFNKILTTIDRNKFNHKNKIGKLKFNDINDLINNIKNNAISETGVKIKINELNKIKEVETKGERLIDSQQKLLSLLDDLKTSFNSNYNSDNNKSDSNNKNESKHENKNKNENENKDGKDDGKYYLEQINNCFEKVDKTKSFKDQIDVLKEIPDLDDYWYIKYYEDNEEINLRLFKLKLAHILNDVDDNLFKEIFGFTSVELADKLINTTSKEDNQMIIDHIEIKKNKILNKNIVNL